MSKQSAGNGVLRFMMNWLLYAELCVGLNWSFYVAILQVRVEFQCDYLIYAMWFTLFSQCLFQKCFDLTFESFVSDQHVVYKESSLFFTHLGSTIIDLFFVADKDGVNWLEFLRGYTKCCGRMVASTLFNNLFRVFSMTCSKAGLPVDLQFELYDDDCKISGLLSPHDILILLSICWIFSWDSRTLKLNSANSKGKCSLPDISHLVLSAVESCTEDGLELDFWDSIVSELDIRFPAAKVHLWALKSIPNLADCFVQFVHARLCYLTIHEVLHFFLYS